MQWGSVTLRKEGHPARMDLDRGQQYAKATNTLQNSGLGAGLVFKYGSMQYISEHFHFYITVCLWAVGSEYSPMVQLSCFSATKQKWGKWSHLVLTERKKICTGRLCVDVAITRTCLCVSAVRMATSSLRDGPGARAPASSLKHSCLQCPAELGMGAWLEKHNNSVDCRSPESLPSSTQG